MLAGLVEIELEGRPAGFERQVVLLFLEMDLGKEKGGVEGP